VGDAADVIGRLLVRVYEMHERVITRGGGSLEGIRDATLLHAAVAHPFATFGEVELYPTDFDKAAALFHSLIKSHPFMDDTKRTAFAAAVYFLHERGYTLQRPFPKDEIIRFCVELAAEGQRLAEGKPIAAIGEAAPFQIGYWFSRQPLSELIEQAGFADTGFPDNPNHLSVPAFDLRQQFLKSSKLTLPAYERAQGPLLPSGQRRAPWPEAQDFVAGDWLSFAFDLDRWQRLQADSALHQPSRGLTEQDSIGLSHLLEPGSQVGRIPYRGVVHAQVVPRCCQPLPGQC